MTDVKKKLSITSFIILLLVSLVCASACGMPEENEGNYEFTPLTATVFADVQLERENFGNTRNAYLALRNHFNYAKSIGAEVVFMPGDVTKLKFAAYSGYPSFYLKDLEVH